MGKVGTPRHKNLLGQRFGRLTVIAESSDRDHSRSMKWVCKCDCGNIKTVSAQALKKGLTVSCGCYNKEKQLNKDIHGHEKGGKKSPTYISWEKMLSRCYREADPAYRFYGARGIKVCDEWHAFKNFLKDMGERPEGKTIDRIDSKGNYEPNNCRWLTPKEQANNMSRNVRFEYNGKKLTISELADLAGLKYDTMYSRLMIYKWPLVTAMSIKRLNNRERSLYAAKSRLRKRLSRSK